MSAQQRTIEHGRHVSHARDVPPREVVIQRQCISEHVGHVRRRLRIPVFKRPGIRSCAIKHVREVSHVVCGPRTDALSERCRTREHVGHINDIREVPAIEATSE